MRTLICAARSHQAERRPRLNVHKGWATLGQNASNECLPASSHAIFIKARRHSTGSQAVKSVMMMCAAGRTRVS